MDTTALKARIDALNMKPTDALVAKVLELHSLSVSDSTIRKAWRALDKEVLAAKKEAAKKEAEAKKNGGSTGTPTPAATPAGSKA
jgi:Arc/MetJ family transcription regulator